MRVEAYSSEQITGDISVVPGVGTSRGGRMATHLKVDVSIFVTYFLIAVVREILALILQVAPLGGTTEGIVVTR